MNLQILDGSYINTRFITTYFRHDKTIQVRMHDGELKTLLEYDKEIDQLFLDIAVRIIGAKKLRQPTLSHHDFWRELIHQL